ncbi:MAG: hypothetical protein QXM43_03325, partial [Desulfurococcaceae archaeon]
VAAEAGADVIAIPYIREVSVLQKIAAGIHVPIFISDTMIPFGAFSIDNLKVLLDGGASGLLISREIFQSINKNIKLEEIVKILYNSIHGGLAP